MLSLIWRILYIVHSTPDWRILVVLLPGGSSSAMYLSCGLGSGLNGGASGNGLDATRSTIINLRIDASFTWESYVGLSIIIMLMWLLMSKTYMRRKARRCMSGDRRYAPECVWPDADDMHQILHTGTSTTDIRWCMPGCRRHASDDVCEEVDDIHQKMYVETSATSISNRMPGCWRQLPEDAARSTAYTRRCMPVYRRNTPEDVC